MCRIVQWNQKIGIRILGVQNAISEALEDVKKLRFSRRRPVFFFSKIQDFFLQSRIEKPLIISVLLCTLPSGSEPVP